MKPDISHTATTNNSVQLPFGELGYLQLKSAFDRISLDIALRHLLRAFKSEHMKFVSSGLMPEYSRDKAYPTNPDDMKSILCKMPSFPISEVATCQGSVSLEARLSQHLINLILSSSVLQSALKRIFGETSSLYMHLAPAVRVVYPGNTVALVPNHIDIGYNSHIQLLSPTNPNLGPFPPPFVTGWIPLQGTAATHGGLRLYPGLFKNRTKISDHSHSFWVETETDATDSTKSFWLDSIYCSDEGGIVPDYILGDCILFHPNLVHGSAPNPRLSRQDKFCEESFRVSMDVRFFSESSTTTKHYLSLSTGQRFNPGEGPCAR